MNKMVIIAALLVVAAVISFFFRNSGWNKIMTVVYLLVGFAIAMASDDIFLHRVSFELPDWLLWLQSGLTIIFYIFVIAVGGTVDHHETIHGLRPQHMLGLTISILFFWHSLFVAIIGSVLVVVAAKVNGED